MSMMVASFVPQPDIAFLKFSASAAVSTLLGSLIVLPSFLFGKIL